MWQVTWLRKQKIVKFSIITQPPYPGREPQRKIKQCLTLWRDLKCLHIVHNDFCLVPDQKEKTGSTLRTKIKEDWITMLTFFCFLLLLPNPSLHPIQPSSPSYQAFNPLTALRAPSSRSLLANPSCLTYCPLPGSFLPPPYLHINGTVPLDLCLYQSVRALVRRILSVAHIPPRRPFHEKVV